MVVKLYLSNVTEGASQKDLALSVSHLFAALIRHSPRNTFERIPGK